jgi:exodeoxyribonuclease VII small subunit
VSESDLGYAAMLAELESILRDLDAVDVDVDVLAERVARAAWLVDACRQRIDQAQLAVEQVVASIDAGTGQRERQDG